MSPAPALGRNPEHVLRALVMDGDANFKLMKAKKKKKK